MMRVLRPLGAALALGICFATGRPVARELVVTELLDQYAAGKFDDVTDELAKDINFEELLNQLKRDAPAWLEAGGSEDRSRRELTAATFALEAARAGEWREWKWVVMQPRMCTKPPPGETGLKPECYEPLNVLFWRPPPLLIEWACELLRKDEKPRPMERWWQLAALAVAQRSEDVAFLVGDPEIGKGRYAGEIINTQDEIKHLDHVQKRFAAEPRFMLAQGIARDRMWDDDATKAYSAVIDDRDVGGEAAMRMGAMLFRNGSEPEAVNGWFDRAERQTRDPYVIYLVRYFRAQMLEKQKKLQDAQAAYRGAAAAWPHAQAATLALATSLFREGKRAEAFELTEAMLEAKDPLFDPWREYVHADDRFWPYLLGKLRAGIAK